MPLFRIEKRRKVNKSEFIQGDSGLLFGNYLVIAEKTFGHRDQVYGEIKKEEEFPAEQHPKPPQ